MIWRVMKEALRLVLAAGDGKLSLGSSSKSEDAWPKIQGPQFFSPFGHQITTTISSIFFTEIFFWFN
jgi:hypothetical protein